MRLPFLFAVVLAAAVGGPANVMAQAGPEACSVDAPPGVSERRLRSGDLDRTYRLFVPANRTAGTPLPLVLDLHGSGGTAAGQAATSRFEALAEAQGFLVASLQAPAATGNRWNVPVTDDRPDDVAYVAGVIDDISSRACVDPARIYATGFSGGARMSSLLGCRLNSRIAAIAPMAGLRWPPPCDGRAIPVLTIHGLADPQNTYEGGVEGRGGEWVESVPDALAGWARHNDCEADPVLDDPPGPLSTLRYEGCRNDVETRLIRVDELTHRWPRDGIDATAVIWDFFSEQSL